MVALAEILTAEDKVKSPFARADLRAGDNKIPNGTTDSCRFGWQTMEERDSYGGPGSTDTAFSPSWALHEMQNADNGAGLYLGPNQQAFINAMHTPGQIHILNGANG